MNITTRLIAASIALVMGCVDTPTSESDPSIEARGNRCRAETDQISLESPLYGDFLITPGVTECCHSYQIDGVSLSHCVTCGAKWKCTAVQ